MADLVLFVGMTLIDSEIKIRLKCILSVIVFLEKVNVAVFAEME